MAFTVRILSIDQLTHDVHSFKTEKPSGYNFAPGQATEVAIKKPGWENRKRPFTFTSLNDDTHLEFIIKSYKQHPGVTNELLNLQPGDEMIIDEPWGTIEYKGAGYFFAGGAGITPFISIFRELHRKDELKDSFLFFSNKTTADIILRDELSSLMGGNVLYLITDEPADKPYFNGFIDESFIKEHVNDFSKQFYICGPPSMTEKIQGILLKFGAFPEAIVFEK